MLIAPIQKISELRQSGITKVQSALGGEKQLEVAGMTELSDDEKLMSFLRL